MATENYLVKHSEQISVANAFSAKFHNSLKIEAHDGGYKFNLLEDFSMDFCWDIENNCPILPTDNKLRKFKIVTLTAREGFESDLISSPRFLWSLFPPFGSGLKASVIHDLLYRNDVHSPSGQFYTQKDADLIFKIGLIVEGVTNRKSWAMYNALRLVGFRAWEENRGIK